MMMMIKIFVNIIIIGYFSLTVFTLKNTPKENDSLERKQKAKNS